MYVTKFMYVIGLGCPEDLQRVQIKPFLGKIFIYPSKLSSSAMVINMDFLCHRHQTDMPRARITSYNYREKTPI